MPVKNHHDKPFDQETIAKLSIFEDYAQAWIPTFVMQGKQEIYIFDFFAGPGRDKNGQAGSPIRTLMKIQEFIDQIIQKNVRIRVFLNEFDKKKFPLLKESCTEYLQSHESVARIVSISYFNKDFDEIFNELFPLIESHPALVYLDQNGIKFLSKEYILKLEQTAQTDFLYFVSSSQFGRFGSGKEFRTYLEIDMEEIKNKPFKFIHRSLVDAIRKMLPPQTQLKLHPFSIKKGSNIHGIIFGASHPRAVDKFLKIAWRHDKENGEANFDIDADGIPPGQIDIFGNTKLSKKEAFQQSVFEKVLSQEITNNFELFNYSLEEGHIGAHADEVLRKMKRSGEVTYENKSPLVTYEKVYKTPEKLDYRVISQ